MGDKFDELANSHIEFINCQHIFFVGTAGAEGFVNISPKGMDSLRIVDSSRVAWLNLTGSGNETAAHVHENGRMTVMFCSFDKHPRILRLYGQSTVIHSRDDGWDQAVALFPEDVGARQVFELEIELVLSSCGYGVPYYEYKDERPTLAKWAISHGRAGIEEYWEEENIKSLNDKDTWILSDE